MKTKHTPTRKFAVLVTDGNSGYSFFRIHKAGCRDIPLEEHKTHGHSWEQDGLNAEQVIRDVQKDQEAEDNPFAREHFTIAPCAIARAEGSNG